MQPTDIISLVLVAVTGVYVYLTWRIAESNKRSISLMSDQFQETVRPFIVPKIAIDHGVIVCLEIENTGKSPATDLTLKIDRDFFQFAEDTPERNVRTFEAFSQTIRTFAPGEILRFDLAQGFNIDRRSGDRNLTPKNFVVSATYNSNKHKYTETYHIDIAPYMHTHPRKSTSEYLEIMSKALEKIASRK